MHTPATSSGESDVLSTAGRWVLQKATSTRESIENIESRKLKVPGMVQKIHHAATQLTAIEGRSSYIPIQTGLPTLGRILGSMFRWK